MILVYEKNFHNFFLSFHYVRLNHFLTSVCSQFTHFNQLGIIYQTSDLDVLIFHIFFFTLFAIDESEVLSHPFL